MSKTNEHYFLGDVTDEAVASIIMQTTKRNDLYLSSRGGDVTSAFTFFDTIRLSKANLRTTALGQTGSAAIIMLLAAPKKERRISKNGILFLHEISWQETGSSNVIQPRDKAFSKLPKGIRKSLELTRDVYVHIVSQQTGLSKSEVSKLMQHEAFLEPKDAVNKGFVNEII